MLYLLCLLYTMRIATTTIRYSRLFAVPYSLFATVFAILIFQTPLKDFNSFHTLSTRVWMRPMLPTNKIFTYSPVMSLATKQSRIRGKCYSPLDLQPLYLSICYPWSFLRGDFFASSIEFLFAFLGPGFFSRFRFPDRFTVVSQQIRLTFLLAWTTNETHTLREHIA